MTQDIPFNNVSQKALPGQLVEMGQYGHTDDIKKLLACGADINEKDSSGNTALVWAAHRNDGVMARYLIDNKAKLDEKDEFGNTALCCAVERGHTFIVRLLIEAGADLDIKYKNRDATALILALENRKPEIALLLINHGADVHVKEKFRKTAESLATDLGYKDIVQLIKNIDETRRLAAEEEAKQQALAILQRDTSAALLRDIRIRPPLTIDKGIK